MPPKIPQWAWYAAGLLIVALMGAWLFGGPIIGFLNTRLVKQEQKTERAADQASSNGLETEAAHEIAGAVDQHQNTTDAAAASLAPIIQRIRIRPDAQTPLAADDLADLHAYDQRLLELRQQTAEAAAARAAAASGDAR